MWQSRKHVQEREPNIFFLFSDDHNVFCTGFTYAFLIFNHNVPYNVTTGTVHFIYNGTVADSEMQMWWRACVYLLKVYDVNEWQKEQSGYSLQSLCPLKAEGRRVILLIREETEREGQQAWKKNNRRGGAVIKSNGSESGPNVWALRMTYLISSIHPYKSTYYECKAVKQTTRTLPLFIHTRQTTTTQASNQTNRAGVVTSISTHQQLYQFYEVRVTLQ